MDNHSDEDYINEIKEKPTIKKQKRFGMKEEDFVKIIQFYPCLFEKSQTSEMKMKKLDALQAVEDKVEQMYGIQLNSSQIRKKIENMKGRIKAKGDKKKTGNFPIKLKSHEEQLLNLMDYKIHGAEQFGLTGTSKECDVAEDMFKVEEQPGSSRSIPQLLHVMSTPRKRNHNNKCLVLELQKEVLLQQKELNQQKKELNNQQKEIFVLQKEKLLLEIDLLKNKQN